MTESKGMVRLLAELKRRKVFRVAAIYGAGAFAVLQAVDIVAEGLNLPPVVLTIVTVAVLVGFPVAIVAAWVYERQPEGGLRRTQQADAAQLRALASEPRTVRWASGALALAGLALLALGVWLVAGRLRSGADPGPPSRTESMGTAVVVMPFSVQGSPEVGYLGQGMVSLLGTSLDGAGDLRAVDSRSIVQTVEREDLAIGDREAAAAVARSFDASLFVIGDIVEAGGRLKITASLYDGERGAEPVSRGQAEGAEDEMFQMVDHLTAQLLSGVAGGAAARVRRIAAVTTESLPALKAFLEGEEEFRRGQFSSSVESFRRAIESDSTFALAYYRLSLVAEWNLQDRLSRQAAEQAVRYADRLADRDRRLLSAFLIRRRGENLAAADAYRSILGEHPDEMEAWLDLAEVQFHANPLYGQSFTQAVESLEHVLGLDPDHSTALIHLARLRAYEADTVALAEIAGRFASLDPDPARLFEVAALEAYGRGDSERIRVFESSLPEVGDEAASLAVWAAAVYCRDPGAGERVTRAMVGPRRSPEARRLGRAWLASFAAAHGRWQDVRLQLDSLAVWSPGAALEWRAILYNLPFAPVTEAELQRLGVQLEDLDPADVATSDNPSVIFTAHDAIHPVIKAYELGLTRARLGDPAAALAQAERLGGFELLPTAGSLGADLAAGIRAEVLRRQGRPGEALAELENARMDTWYGQTMSSPLFARIRERFLRAELLYELGRLEEAQAWYGTIGQISPFELPYLAPAQLRLSEIASSLGDSARAEVHRTALRRLWEGADPEASGALGL